VISSENLIQIACHSRDIVMDRQTHTQMYSLQYFATTHMGKVVKVNSWGTMRHRVLQCHTSTVVETV